MFRANPSPNGRGWCEAPGEGYHNSNFSILNPSPVPSAHPLPLGEGFARNIFLYVGQQWFVTARTPESRLQGVQRISVGQCPGKARRSAEQFVNREDNVWKCGQRNRFASMESEGVRITGWPGIAI